LGGVWYRVGVGRVRIGALYARDVEEEEHMFGRKQQRQQVNSSDQPVGTGEYQEHTAEHPFCHDLSCSCHEDQGAIQETFRYVQDGLLSVDDANRRFRGRTV
jgi:hypothetical protein